MPWTSLQNLPLRSLRVAHGSGTNLDEAPQTTLAPTNGDPMEGMPALTTRATRLCSLLRARQPFLLRWRSPNEPMVLHTPRLKYRCHATMMEIFGRTNSKFPTTTELEVKKSAKRLVLQFPPACSLSPTR